MKKLYHFTAKIFLPSIQKEGITRGLIPVLNKYGSDEFSLAGFLPNKQWLTSNPDFHQSWCDPAHSNLPYDRTQARLTIKLPDHLRQVAWKVMSKHPMLRDSAEILGAFGDPENWFIVDGMIPPDAIVGVDFKDEDGKEVEARPE